MVEEFRNMIHDLLNALRPFVKGQYTEGDLKWGSKIYDLANKCLKRGWICPRCKEYSCNGKECMPPCGLCGIVGCFGGCHHD